MNKILINGLNSKTGGGRSILKNYLSLLKNSTSTNYFYVLCPNVQEYKEFSNHFIKIIEINPFLTKSLLSPFSNLIIIPKLLKKYKIDKILNFADIIIPTKCHQVYLFDWPYAVFPESIVWKRMSWMDYISRKVKLFLFRKSIKYVSSVIVQTETMKKRLNSIYGLNNIIVIPNAVTLENLKEKPISNFNLPKDKIKLLYLTYYYSHKNIEILLPLAKKIKELSLPFCIIITIEQTQHKNAKKIIKDIKKCKIEQVIQNIGEVSMANVPSLYKQCDALLMPTLIESYGLPYIEAMFHKKTILTSDFDFARDVCGEAAYYFNPIDVNSILDTINEAFTDTEKRISFINEGKKKIEQLLSWDQVFNKYQEILGNI